MIHTRNANNAEILETIKNFNKVCTTKVAYWGFSEGNEGYRSRCESAFKMGLAYRKLIGSLYESWKIGIEKVFK